MNALHDALLSVVNCFVTEEAIQPQIAAANRNLARGEAMHMIPEALEPDFDQLYGDLNRVGLVEYHELIVEPVAVITAEKGERHRLSLHELSKSRIIDLNEAVWYATVDSPGACYECTSCYGSL